MAAGLGVPTIMSRVSGGLEDESLPTKAVTDWLGPPYKI